MPEQLPVMVDLFTGIGGFSLAAEGLFNVVVHVEKDRDCQNVIRYHFPDTLLLDDVETADESNLPKADIVTFGSPCQDLSIAGKRGGLAGKRSGLFYEAIRIVRLTGARFAWWENVPGALSSNGGEDFRVVIREMLGSDVPMPKSGRWATSGMVRNGTSSVAWRVLDAQFFGVPQRRRRVFVIADTRGECAPEVLFEQTSGTRNTQKGKKTRQGSSRTPKNGAENDGWGMNPGTFTVRNGKEGGGKGFLGFENGAMTVGPQKQWLSEPSIPDKVGALDAGGSGSDKSHGGACPGTTVQSAQSGHAFPMAYNIQTNDGGESHRKDRPEGGFYVSETDTSLTVGGTNMTAIVDNPDITGSVSSKWAKGTGGPAGDESYNLISTNWDTQRSRIHDSEGVAPTLQGSGGKGGQRTPTVAIKPETLWHEHRQDETIRIQDDDKSPTVSENWGAGGGNVPFIGVRRLMPIECERLQGFPDNWTLEVINPKGKQIQQSDSARYRQCGNAVAVVVVRWIAKRLSEVIKNERCS